MKSKVYVASSWRNASQSTVVDVLRAEGHEVYDFKNPKPGDKGFSWSAIDPNWINWTAEQYIEALNHPIAQAGFQSDFDAMKWADTFLLVLPCGRSAHLELGWAVGAGKRTFLLTQDGQEPELMAKMCDKICSSLDDAMRLIAEDFIPVSTQLTAAQADVARLTQHHQDDENLIVMRTDEIRGLKSDIEQLTNSRESWKKDSCECRGMLACANEALTAATSLNKTLVEALKPLEVIANAYSKAMMDAGVSHYPEALALVRNARATLAVARPPAAGDSAARAPKAEQGNAQADNSL